MRLSYEHFFSPRNCGSMKKTIEIAEAWDAGVYPPRKKKKKEKRKKLKPNGKNK